ncbi:hypothetical protein C9397_04735 [Xanthomonas vasicola pv. vasculorum]|uniref:Uncharacterized protein n=2 Tax=Xanthomonas vasicola TaxID=56459 RepID=A0AAE8F7D1_XANVA|nr:hypothetical protein NX81_007660 [Xanthomonas vasicola]AZR30277.1 hypothetical protein KWO_006735 [Xanthomonas vasicola pv. musacearum NCPPB 4379]PUE71011.1 hypothetical protein C7Y63_04805 [Xanthomonas vasicola pv. vasculorum]RRJ37916.1 hypothetical protein EIM46_16235 [Xanthomonas vasicola pv. musacearum]PUE75044.1 hypothetical protein C7Y61_04775 [Xanthomonas vasicola pv. vasculorum]
MRTRLTRGEGGPRSQGVSSCRDHNRFNRLRAITAGRATGYPLGNAIACALQAAQDIVNAAGSCASINTRPHKQRRRAEARRRPLL